MRVTINGEATDLPTALTVEGLLAARGLTDRPCAVEINKALIPKAKHVTTMVDEGDAVEIVTLVGGG